MVRLTRSIGRYKADVRCGAQFHIMPSSSVDCVTPAARAGIHQFSSAYMAMVKIAAPAASLALVVVMAMMVGSAQAAACSPQFPLSCASYVLDSRSVPLKTCCIEVQDNFQLLKSTSSLKSYCEAIKGVKLFDGPLTGTELSLALGLPEKCALSGQYKKGQKCNGTIMPGGS